MCRARSKERATRAGRRSTHKRGRAHAVASPKGAHAVAPQASARSSEHRAARSRRGKTHGARCGGHERGAQRETRARVDKGAARADQPRAPQDTPDTRAPLTRRSRTVISTVWGRIFDITAVSQAPRARLTSRYVHRRGNKSPTHGARGTRKAVAAAR